MADHMRPISDKKPVLFIAELEQPSPAQCKQLPGLPVATTLMVGEECFKGQ